MAHVAGSGTAAICKFSLPSVVPADKGSIRTPSVKENGLAMGLNAPLSVSK